MNIAMSGLDYEQAPVQLREKLSFTRSAVMELDRSAARRSGVAGAVLLSTCNRTELYLSCGDGCLLDPGRVLCEAAGVGYDEFAAAFVTRRGPDCARHLMEVSCGLCSQILGEDQILTQVKAAAAAAREAGTADAALETLFHTSAACGKAVKTQLRLSGRPTSAAHSAVDALERHFGELNGRRALVIGNGEMGRLAASLLHGRGCAVTVTLRSYHHGATVVPAGCSVVPYDERYGAMEQADLLVSATTSPHYTVSAAQFAALRRKPAVLVDLAMPRDIEPQTASQARLLNIDDLGQNVGLDGETARRAAAVVDEHLSRFYRWSSYRDCMPAVDELRDAVLERVRTHVAESADAEDAAESAALRAVDLLIGGFADCLSPEKVRLCAEGIRSRTRMGA